MTRRHGFTLLGLLLAGATLGAQAPRVHELTVAPERIHWGYYDARVKPVLRVASGDRVNVETMIAGGLTRLRMLKVPDAEIPKQLLAVEAAITDRGPGAHPMTGPIYVEGAEPGDAIEAVPAEQPAQREAREHVGLGDTDALGRGQQARFGGVVKRDAGFVTGGFDSEDQHGRHFTRFARRSCRRGFQIQSIASARRSISIFAMKR